MDPETAKEYFKQKQNKPVAGYQIFKNLCKLKSSGIKKIFKELPVFKCEHQYIKMTNYLAPALTAYKAAAAASFDI